MPWTTSPKVMEIRNRSEQFDVLVGTLDGWRRHMSARNASLLSFFFFLSIFPLMLAATTILGFVLEGRDDLRQDLLDGAVADIPLIGSQLAEQGQLTGNIWALIIGLGGALWSATKAFVALHGALDDTWEIDVDDRAKMPKQRARALLAIVFIGAGQVASMAIAGVIGAAGLPAIGNIALLVGTVAVNAGIVAAMYRFLTSEAPSWRQVVPGSLFAGVIITALQNFGVTIVKIIAENAGDTYGTFATILALITWLGFIAITLLMGAELNAYVARRTAAGGPVVGRENVAA